MTQKQQSSFLNARNQLSLFFRQPQRANQLSDRNNEFSLIEWVRQRAQTRDGVVLGIGDDAAIVDAGPQTVVATDMLMEGRHFQFPDAAPEQAGRKSLAVNLSDLAAMAAKPQYALVSVSFPQQKGRDFAERVMDGIVSLADQFEVAIVGGDTNSWDGPLVINVVVMGTVESESALRSTAKAGDWILATGEFGGSLLAPAMHHLNFTPRVNESLAISQQVQRCSMIDVSDGLAADLHHILDESHVGCLLNADAVPIRNTVIADSSGTRLQHALGDGEDFELLFTLSPEDAQQLLSDPPPGVRLTKIGEITAASDRILVCDGKQQPLPRLGWNHSLS